MQDEQAIPMKHVTIEALPDAPVDTWLGSSAVIGNKVAYFKSYGSKTVYEFNNNQWHKLPPCPNSYFTIVSVDDMLTTLGGQYYTLVLVTNSTATLTTNGSNTSLPCQPDGGHLELCTVTTHL